MHICIQMYLQYVFICFCTIDDLLYFIYSIYFMYLTVFNVIIKFQYIDIFVKIPLKTILVKIPLKKERMD